MKKYFLGIGTLLLVVLMVVISTRSIMAQTNPPSNTDLPGLINGLGLSQDQLDKTMKLSRDFLTEFQKGNQELTGLMTPPAPGSQADPKSPEKISIVQRQFGLKLEQYHLDLIDTIGDEKALKIIEAIHGIIPEVLLQGSKIAAMNHNAHGNTTPGTNNDTSGNNTSMPGMNMAGTNTPTTPNTNSNSNMTNMPGMNTPNTNSNSGMSNMPNTNSSGIDAINRQILVQLQSSNAMLIQMLNMIADRSDAGNLKILLQPIYQMIANQSALIQMLYSNLTTNSANTGSNNSGGMGMNKMGM